MYLDNCAHDKLASDASCREDKELLMGSVASRTMVLWLHELEVADRRYLTQAQAASAAAHGRKHLEIISALSRFASSSGILRWKVLPKHHDFGLASCTFF